MTPGEIPEYFNDFRALDTETMVWSKVRAEAEEFPSARYGHSLTPLGPDLMVLFGGWGLGGLQCKQENTRRGSDSFVVSIGQGDDPRNLRWAEGQLSKLEPRIS